jgi:hypothetical protein
MPSRLGNSAKIVTLARDLKIDGDVDPAAAILEFCDQRIRKLLKRFPNTDSLTGLLDVAASGLGTKFEILRTQADLAQIMARYTSRTRREPGFANLANEVPTHVFGVTLRLSHPEGWELPYVSIIDCRGEKAAREYFTKWHEVGHLLILTDQQRLTFYRTHSADIRKDPEERIVDAIASRIGFYAPIIQKHAQGLLSFDKLESIRAQLCSVASRESSLIGFIQAWPRPCIYVRAELGLRKDEESMLRQASFSFRQIPSPKLRAVKVIANDTARLRGAMHKNMRVPEQSVIHRVYDDPSVNNIASEDLSWWSSSEGRTPKPCSVVVEAQKIWDGVEALIQPTNDS